MPDWPEPIQTLRNHFPEEMRLLRGGAGFVSGIVLVFAIFVGLLGGNWQLGYAHDWILTSIFGLFVPGAIGLVSPLWYWVGRPVWDRIDRPGNRYFERWRTARFLPGQIGAVLGISLFSLVNATSGFWIQTLIPFGLALGLGSPVWFWLLRPLAKEWSPSWVPAASETPFPEGFAGRTLSGIGVLFVMAVAVTAVIALPVAAIGEPVTSNGLTVSIPESRTTTEVIESDGESRTVTHDWRFLLVRLSVDNEANAPRSIPGRTEGDVAVIAPECSANNFGEPANNCNQAYLDGDFRADGKEYPYYDTRQEAVGGTIRPGEGLSGWVVFRIENRPVQNPSFDAMVVIDDVGRWRLPDEWRA